MFGSKQHFLGSGSQLKPSPPYCAYAQLTEPCSAGHWNQKMGVSRPPPGKRPTLCSKYGLKRPILGKKTLFFELVWSVSVPAVPCHWDLW